MLTKFLCSNRYHVLVAVALAGLAALGSTLPARAQQSGLALSPAIFEAVLEPGMLHTQKVKLRNITGVTLPIRVQARQLYPPEDVRITEGMDRSVFDASQWFSFDQSEYILQPGEERETTIFINPPPDAEPGGHYATVLFTPLVAEDTLKSNSAYLASEVGSLAFMVVQGNIIESAVLEAPSRPPRLLHFGPIETSFELINTGNVHNLPTGAFRITNLFGKEVAYEKVPLRMVLPGTAQPFKLRWGRAFMLNRYTITPEFTFGSPPGQLAVQPVTVWVVPWVPLLVLLVAIGLAVRSRKRWKRAWQVLRGEEPPARSKSARH